RTTGARLRLRLCDHPRAQESLDLRLGDAGGAKHLDGVLADLRREGRGHLLLAADVERARHGVRGARPRVVNGHEGTARAHLLVVGHVVEGGDYAKGDPGLLEDGRPGHPVFRLEPLIEDSGEDRGVGAPSLRRLKAWIGDEILAPDASREALPVALVS